MIRQQFTGEKNSPGDKKLMSKLLLWVVAISEFESAVCRENKNDMLVPPANHTLIPMC